MPKRIRNPKQPSEAAADPAVGPAAEVPATYAKPAKAPRPRRVSEPATYNLYEAKTQLSELVARAAAGETIVIAKAGVPMAHLTPLPAPEKPPPRQPGLLKGAIWIADDFDDPLPPEIQKYFDDPPIWPEEWEAMRRQEREDDERRERERQATPRGETP